MSDLTNQQLLETLRREFATKDDILVVREDIKRLGRKFDDHKAISVEQHLKILEEIGHLNRQFIKVTEFQDGLGKRFSKLRIVTE